MVGVCKVVYYLLGFILNRYIFKFRIKKRKVNEYES